MHSPLLPRRPVTPSSHRRYILPPSLRRLRDPTPPPGLVLSLPVSFSSPFFPPLSPSPFLSLLPLLFPCARVSPLAFEPIPDPHGPFSLPDFPGMYPTQQVVLCVHVVLPPHARPRCPHLLYFSSVPRFVAILVARPPQDRVRVRPANSARSTSGSSGYCDALVKGGIDPDRKPLTCQGHLTEQFRGQRAARLPRRAAFRHSGVRGQRLHRARMLSAAETHGSGYR